MKAEEIWCGTGPWAYEPVQDNDESDDDDAAVLTQPINGMCDSVEENYLSQKYCCIYSRFRFASII